MHVCLSACLPVCLSVWLLVFAIVAKEQALPWKRTFGHQRDSDNGSIDKDQENKWIDFNDTLLHPIQESIRFRMTFDFTFKKRFRSKFDFGGMETFLPSIEKNGKIKGNWHRESNSGRESMKIRAENLEEAGRKRKRPKMDRWTSGKVGQRKEWRL